MNKYENDRSIRTHCKNKFRPVVEKELKEFNHDIVEEVLLEKQGKVYGMFDV